MKTEHKHVLPTGARPQTIEHPGTASPPTGSHHKHHLPTSKAPQTRHVPGLGEELVKSVEPAKVERRNLTTKNAEGAKTEGSKVAEASA